MSPSANQRTMATRLATAKREIPHFYLSIDVEVSGLLEIRRELNGITGRPRVSITHLLVAAIAQALRAAPLMNRAWIDDEIVTSESIDVGVAVDTRPAEHTSTLQSLIRISYAVFCLPHKQAMYA